MVTLLYFASLRETLGCSREQVALSGSTNTVSSLLDQLRSREGRWIEALAPGKQWRVGREYLRRLKLALDEHGVETPVPSLKLAVMDQSPPLDATKS